jgi:hypothetical protein
MSVTFVCISFILLGSLTCRKMLRHGADVFLFPPKEVLRTFLALKEIHRPRPGFYPRTLGPMTSTITTRPEVLKLWVAPPPGGSAVGLFWGGGESCLCGHIYFGSKIKYIIWYSLCSVKYFTYHLVPILAMGFKKHILSPAKVSLFFLPQQGD